MDGLRESVHGHPLLLEKQGTWIYTEKDGWERIETKKMKNDAK
jgi:hypothetical protein